MPSSEEIYNAYYEAAKKIDDADFKRFGFESKSLAILVELAQLLTEITEEFVRLQSIIKSEFKEVDMSHCDLYVAGMTEAVETAKLVAGTNNPFKIRTLTKQLMANLNSFSETSGYRSCIKVTDAASCAFAKLQLAFFEVVVTKLDSADYAKIPRLYRSKIRSALTAQLEKTRDSRIPYLEKVIAAQEAQEKADKTSQTAATTRALLIELAEVEVEVEVEPGPEHHTKARVIAVHAEPEPAPELKVKPSTSPAASDDEALDDADDTCSVLSRRF